MATESLPRTVRLTTALVLVATFAAGMVTGFGLWRWLGRGEPPDHPPHACGPIPLEELGLSEEQRAKAQAVLERHRPELDAILRETYPKANAVRETIEREIRELLTPEQRQRFDEFKSRRPPRPPGPPGLLPPFGSGPGHWGPPGPPPFHMPPGLPPFHMPPGPPPSGSSAPGQNAPP